MHGGLIQEPIGSFFVSKTLIDRQPDIDPVVIGRVDMDLALPVPDKTIHPLKTKPFFIVAGTELTVIGDGELIGLRVGLHVEVDLGGTTVLEGVV